MDDYKDLIAELRENAEWAEANIYEVPIMLPDYLKQAADAIEQLVKERDELVTKCHQPEKEPVPTESEFERIAIQRGYVPVVRCKDCKDWSRTYEQYDCCMKRRYIYTDHNYCECENDYCSHAERKDEVSE